MSSYYIYAYIRTNGTPYYIGKGKGDRAYTSHKSHNISTPRDTSKIIIMESNLTELGAFALERFYIRWYGRKDNNTGILHNRSDGGDGISGYKHTPEALLKISLASRGRVKTISERQKLSIVNTGKKHSIESRQRMSKSAMGRKMSDETKLKMANAQKGKTLSIEHRQKIGMSNKIRAFEKRNQVN